jgi:hypothetical protein
VRTGALGVSRPTVGCYRSSTRTSVVTPSRPPSHRSHFLCPHSGPLAARCTTAQIWASALRPACRQMYDRPDLDTRTPARLLAGVRASGNCSGAGSGCPAPASCATCVSQVSAPAEPKGVMGTLHPQEGVHGHHDPLTPDAGAGSTGTGGPDVSSDARPRLRNPRSAPHPGVWSRCLQPYQPAGVSAFRGRKRGLVGGTTGVRVLDL